MSKNNKYNLGDPKTKIGDDILIKENTLPKYQNSPPPPPPKKRQ